MTMPVEDEEEFTELRDAVIGRMDGVGKAANGIPRFLIAKQAADDQPRGLFAPDFVRDLIAKSEPEPAPQETVTMTGSPAAMAALIHGAPVRKAAPGPLKKADGSPDGLDPTTVLAEPESDTPGDVNDPGSPAWEAVDAATARKWTGIAVRLKYALATMAERELLEAATGDADDIGEAWSLQDAECALDYVIDTLAGFAVGEQAEAELGGEAMAAVGKAMAGCDTAALETFEGLAPVLKAGRTLSAGNEASIRGAVDALQKVLASLPAPVDEAGQPVAKQNQETDTMTAPLTPAPAPDTAAPDDVAPDTAPAEVAKAAPEPQLAVYTADGVLFGVVAPDAVMPIAAPETPETAQTEAAEEAAEPEPVIADGEDAEVIPGTSTVASPAADEDEVAKAVQAGFNTALAEALAPIAAELARHAELASVVKGLEERVEHLAKMPDDRKSPLLNGATGQGPSLASRGGTADPLEELKKAVADAPTEAARTQARTALGIAAIKERFA